MRSCNKLFVIIFSAAFLFSSLSVALTAGTTAFPPIDNKATMSKTILVTGSTDGIGLETAKMLLSMGHTVLLHGRSKNKLEKTERALSKLLSTSEGGGGKVERYVCDLSSMKDVEQFANSITEKHTTLDVLINNAGVFKTSSNPVTPEGLDVRFAVNTIAPYLLTQRLLPLLGTEGRVVNLSSAAQSPVDLGALSGQKGSSLSDGSAYAQSKLAITMWTRHMATSHKDGPAFIAVNPGSFLGTKMVQQAYGMKGGDVRKGADILCHVALSEDEFADASGKYFDNDSGHFASLHPDATNGRKCEETVRVIEEVLAGITQCK